MIKKFFRGRNTSSGKHLITNFNPLQFGSKTSFAKHLKFTTSDYDEELLDPPSRVQDTFEIYFNVKKDEDTLVLDTATTKCNLFVIYPKMIGREFNKTTSFMTDYKGVKKSCVFEIVSGEGYIILESLIEPKLVKVIQVLKNSVVFIPNDFAFSFINTSKDENLIALCLIGKRTKTLGNVLKKSAGHVLYYLEKGFTKNQNAAPDYKLEDYVLDYTEDYNFAKEKGLYKEFVELPEKFNFLK